MDTLQLSLKQLRGEAIDAKHSIAKHGKSFNWAARFFSAELSQSVSKLYALCRYLDDLADGDDPSRTQKLRTIKSLFDQHQETKITFDPDLVLSKRALQDMLEGFLFDQGHVAIEHEKDLIQYCYQVAGTVGILMCDVMRINNAQALHHAVHLGIALQLTNIARDVGEDASIGRCYIPKDWTDQLSACELVQRKTPTSELATASKRLLTLADHYYKSGLFGIAYLPPRAGFAIQLAAHVYRDIGRDLQRHRYNNLSYRAHCSLTRKLWLTLVMLSGREERLLQDIPEPTKPNYPLFQLNSYAY